MTNSKVYDEKISSGTVVNSALWAALGDSLGWITELANGQEVRRRVGSERVFQPVKWARTIGGWSGPEVILPSGTYSDDTQLRLAVSRAIRGDGVFDPEVFAKVELPVWLSYSLGAGLGSKAAAANLGRKGANWFSNFYSSKGQIYVNGGGNGAAMRIQPHVWSSNIDTLEQGLLDVLRDSLITHGHAHGFCGAFFHALSLADTFVEGRVPGPDAWKRYADAFLEIPERISADRQLRTFWLGAWEKESGVTLKEAVAKALKEAHADIDVAISLIDAGRGTDSYGKVLQTIGCFDKKYRGSGIKTAIAATVVSWMYRDERIEDALLEVCNQLGSDTDTIATMAGAIMGVVGPSPKWIVQDHGYIIDEASRLQLIRNGETGSTFHYPDLIKWKPPARQSDAVGSYQGGYAIKGLGAVVEKGGAHGGGDDVWQWLELPFGQTVLAKRKSLVKLKVKSEELPGIQTTIHRPTKEDLEIRKASLKKPVRPIAQASLSFFDTRSNDTPSAPESADAQVTGVDYLTDKVIKANFDSLELGRAFNECLDNYESVDFAIAFAGIVAKAKLVRKRRGR